MLWDFEDPKDTPKFSILEDGTTTQDLELNQSDILETSMKKSRKKIFDLSASPKPDASIQAEQLFINSGAYPKNDTRESREQQTS